MSTKQSALTVVRMAQDHAKTELAEHGRIRPGIFMLVLNNPQTDAPLSQATAIGSVLEEGFADAQAQTDFFDGIREETQRLRATAAVLCLQAEAEVEGKSKPVMVALIHIEDDNGITLLHAPIEAGPAGHTLGAFVAIDGAEAKAASGIEPPLLATHVMH